MKIYRRYRKLLAMLITASMVITPMGVFAEEVGTDETAIVGDTSVEDPIKEETDAEEVIDVSEALSDEIAELNSLTPGEDYIDREGVFLCDSLSEAQSIADEYNASLKSFEYGVATVRFRESTKAALCSAEEAGVSALIEPNYMFELYDTDDVDYSSYAATDEDAADDPDEVKSSDAGDEIVAEDAVDSDPPDENDGETELIDPDEASEVSPEEEGISELYSADEEPSYASLASEIIYGSTPDPLEQYYHDRIHTNEALKETSGNGIRIAVLDSGVNDKHEDLQGGRVSVNFIPAMKDNVGIDKSGHGTHVIGIIVAEKGNGKGGYGVAPGVSVDSIQITSGESFPMSNIVTGINMAVAMDVDVISMSFGTTKESQLTAMQTAVDNAYKKGIVCIAAAGNSNGSGGSYTADTTEHYPAACEHCLAVGATDKDEGVLAPFSVYGDWVDVVAPGRYINSSYIKKNNIPTAQDDANAYYTIGGTSQATPMVSAIAALCYAVNPEFKKNKNTETVDLIQAIIRVTTDGVKYVYEDRSITGMVQADKAVQTAKNLNMNPEHTLVDAAGHYGGYLTGYIGERKSIKFRIGGSDGKVSDKSLTKSATWESSNTSKVTVKAGKVKCTKAAEDGDQVIISAAVGSDTLFCILKVHGRVKKFGTMYGGYSVKSRDDVAKRAGQEINIQNPYAAISSNTSEVEVFYTTNKSKLASSEEKAYQIADSRFTYDISISQKDMGKITVNKTDSSGDPVSITPNNAGDVIKVKYKLLDGSNKKFTLKIIVN